MNIPVKITANCKLVTPMLSSGADQYKFEIRASGIKAGLRFWWRAFQPKNGKSLYEDESKIFGNTEHAAPFDIHVSKIPNGVFREKSPGEVIFNANESKKKYGAGIAYALFNITDPVKQQDPVLKLKMKDEREISKSGRPIAMPGSSFQIQINFLRPGKTHQKIGDVFCALWLLENLGGLGGRTRRGAGCFEIQEITMNGKTLKEVVTDEALKPIFENGISEFSFQNNQTPDQYIKTGIDTVMKRWQTDNRIDFPDYTACYSKTSEILVAYNDSKSGPDSALAMMGYINEKIKNYCDTFPYDSANQMHTSLSKGSTLPKDFKLEKASKGLPIIFNFKEEFDNRKSNKLGESFTATTVKMDSSGKPILVKGKFAEGNARKASPLLISCHQKNGSAYVVICRLPAPLMPENEKIWLKTNNSKIDRVIEPPRKPPFDKFVIDLIHNRQEGTDVKCDKFEKIPIIDAFNKAFSMIPYKDISHIKETKIIKGNKDEHEEEVPQNVAALLTQAQSLKQEDKFVLNSLIEKLEKLAAAGEDKHCKKIAQAMKARMEQIGNWKKYPKKNNVESYITE